MSIEAYVNSKIEKGIATIEFFHPSSNSLPSAILNNLADTVTEVSNNESVNVIILKSGGEKAFCAGASFDELIAIQNFDQGTIFFSGFAKVINAMRKSSKLIIARVQGKAVGGGVGLLAAADYTLAVQTASVKLSELAVGIGPFVVGPAVERKVGVAAFSQLSIDATNWQTAQWGKEKGLYVDIYENINDLDNAVNTLAQRLSTSNPEAMKELKNVFWQGTEHWDTLLSQRAAISGKLVLSTFTRNAIQQFKTK